MKRNVIIILLLVTIVAAGFASRLAYRDMYLTKTPTTNREYIAQNKATQIINNEKNKNTNSKTAANSDGKSGKTLQKNTTQDLKEISIKIYENADESNYVGTLISKYPSDVSAKSVK